MVERKQLQKTSSQIEEIQDESLMEKIFNNNRKWVAQKISEDPNYFIRLANVHQPKYLYIGCSDSRVPPQEFLGLKIGELFVHKNIANQVVNHDLNMLSVLQYAVEYLKVKDIIVCGHYECGGIRAANEQKDHGLIEHWLLNIRDQQRIHRKILCKLKTEEQRYRKLIEINVQEQCLNLLANPIVQKAQTEENRPRVIGLVYDVSNGRIKQIEVNLSEIMKDFGDIYKLYNVEQKRKSI